MQLTFLCLKILFIEEKVLRFSIVTSDNYLLISLYARHLEKINNPESEPISTTFSI